MHVRLRPGLRRVWRGPGTVQIGLTPGRAAILDGLTDDDAALVERLRLGVDLAELDAGRVPPGADRGRELLDLLDESGCLLTTRSGRSVLTRLDGARDRLAADAAVWALAGSGIGDGWDVVARRADSVVEVRGTGRTASVVSSTLAAQGVDVRVHAGGRVGAAEVCPAGPGPADVGESRDAVAAAGVTRARGLPAPRPGSGPTDVVVLVGHGAADAVAAQELHATGTAHLSVVVREVDVVVGPLVRPGTGPCLQCLDLHRSDRDPRWPYVLAQLLSPSSAAGGAGEPPAEEVALATVAGGLAALQVVAQLDGRADPAALAATLEVELPDGLAARRPWPVHRACACWR